MYAPDAEYTTDSGERIAGRPAIQEGLNKFFAKNKGAKLDTDMAPRPPAVPGNSTRPCENTPEETVIFCST